MATRTAPLPTASLSPADVLELMPGDVAIGLAGQSLKTLLGSCVSVILTDPRRTVAAMCHIVHASTPKPVDAENTAYGAVAMQEMFGQLVQIGVSPTQCEAYVFGGGNMFPQLFAREHVGEKNIRWTLEFLHAHGIEIVDKNLGGHGYRKVSWTVGPSEPMVETVTPE